MTFRSFILQMDFTPPTHTEVWAPMAVRGGRQRTQYISTVDAMESIVSLKFISSTEINPVSSNKQKIEKRLNDLIREKTSPYSLLLYELRSLFQSYGVDNIEWTDPLSFGCIIDRDSDMIFGKLPEDQRKNLREILDLPYHKFEISPIISELVKVLLERSKSLNKREMMVSLPPISMDFQGNDEEFEDIYVMYRIIDSIRHIWCHFKDENKAEYTEGMYIIRIVSSFLGPLFCYENAKLKIIWAEEVSEASQRRMDDSGETRIGHKPDFRIKSPLIVDEVEICLMEASRDAHVKLLRKLTRRAGEMKDLEEELNKVPVFGIQVAGGTLACWVMTMPFGAFYFVQRLASVQIPMNRRQSSLTEFMNELWKLRATLRNHIRALNEIIEKVDSSLYNIAICSPQAREDFNSLYNVKTVTLETNPKNSTEKIIFQRNTQNPFQKNTNLITQYKIYLQVLLLYWGLRLDDLGLDVTGLDGVELGGARLGGAGLDDIELGGAGLDSAGKQL
ncbi:27583_t:CDS:10 [Dentiscutata erythropus]|uniref:27583_t:CDS:1 n=1 Tax=Dentiscutata erythropus TaxID=1348616 RepID=A0A9N9DTS3_9GLOM|nr:27583_t:CDS:10 [Dentiscutata erythropus]